MKRQETDLGGKRDELNEDREQPFIVLLETLLSLEASEVREKLSVAVMVPGEMGKVLQVWELERNAVVCYGCEASV